LSVGILLVLHVPGYKENYKNKAKLKYVSLGRSPTIVGYVFRILELQFIVLKLPSNTICVISISNVSIDVHFFWC
jgi:hypothetical protein